MLKDVAEEDYNEPGDEGVFCSFVFMLINATGRLLFA
jgi:hypothetical protein